jgi:phosphatidylserine/phosphatidylglycerophosphate/cardiolipin synthase-like enzyme
VKVRLVVGNAGNDASLMQRVKTAGGKVVVTGPASGAGTKTDPYIHAKAIVIDCSGTTCARGYIGSENFSAGSLGYNRELGVIFTQAPELAKVEAAISTDFAAGTAQ